MLPAFVEFEGHLEFLRVAGGLAVGMKSFRFYFKPQVTVPPTLAAAYSKAERAELYENYQARLGVYRRKLNQSVGIAVGIILCAFVVAYGSGPWTGICYCLCPIGLVWLMMVMRSRLPCCSGCENDVDTTLGIFCPRCGKQAIQRGGLFSASECTACGRQLRFGKGGRGFRIWACTHCGIKLDSNGL